MAKPTDQDKAKPVPVGAKVTAKGRVVPLSEDERKFRPDWDRDDCIEELQRIAKAHPDQVVTRNFFRVHSAISEATWNRYFGTFQEFKRQSGIVLSRHAHRLERAIAKHASTDILERFTAEKADYAGKYKRDVGGRFKSVLCCSDVHDRDADPFWRRTFIDTVKRLRPEVIVLGGDIFDLPEFSRWTQDPREWDVVGRIRWVHEFLKDIREAAPDAEILFVEGNHEYRLLRHLAEGTPALRTVLADLHGMTIPGLLGLDQFEINYVAPADLKAWTERDIQKELKRNWTMVLDSFIAHHFPDGANMGYPGFNGHHHKHIVQSRFSPDFGTYEWHQLGSGHRRAAPYCDGEKWSNGFMAAHVDTTKRFTAFEYIDTTHDHAVIGGQFYVRGADEAV